MSQEAGALITALATLALVGVTGWYAYLTHQLSASADRSARASEDAARHAAAAAEASQQGLEVQKAALAVQRASQPMGFRVHAAGPMASGFGFALMTDGGSYLVRGVRLQNMTFKAVGREDSGHTFGQDTPLIPHDAAYPIQLDPPDALIFEVPGVAEIGRRIYGDDDWFIAWWTILVDCSFSTSDEVTRRVDVRSHGAPQFR